MNRGILSVAIVTLFASALAYAQEVRVRVEAEQDDAVKLIERLNDNGKKSNLSFLSVERDYQVRIALASKRSGVFESVIGNSGANASAAVLAPDCRLLFIVSRSGRGTKGGVLNALSKEIVKELADLRHENGL